MNIVLHGCNGKMGHIITGLVRESAADRITAGVDRLTAGAFDYPVYASLKEVREPFDVVIDFSTAAAVSTLLADCAELKKPLVLCTTGLSEEQQAEGSRAALSIPLFFSANMSLGMNLLIALCRRAAHVLAPAGFDIEINERHHRRKIDAPSGTALSIGKALIDELGEEYYLSTDRCERRAPRDAHEIGMTAVRGGTIVGEHTVLFAGQDELLEIRHTALSREIFGQGALQAARFLNGKAPGLYDMNDML